MDEPAFIFPQFPCGMARVSAAEKAGGGVAVALQHFRFNVVPVADDRPGPIHRRKNRGRIFGEVDAFQLNDIEALFV